VRDPGQPNEFWVHCISVTFPRIEREDLLLADSDGCVMLGDGLLSHPAFAIHSAVHRARPDVVAAAHAYAIRGTRFSSSGRNLEPITRARSTRTSSRSKSSD
jgi:ribulose-5-phosphate 4-epimerase/fuculose-1-phosphate aldolase